MIFFLQFPLADIRLFIEGKTGQLTLPTWPSPAPYREFVRSFGLVKLRGKGGIPGWSGESAICDASRAVRFPKLITFSDKYRDQVIDLKCVARHFYFDGIAVGKCEVVLLTKPSILTLSSQSLFDLIRYILQIPVTIPLCDTIFLRKPAGNLLISRKQEPILF